MPTHDVLEKLKNATQICLLLTHLFGLFEGMALTLTSDRNLFWLGQQSDSLPR